MRILCHRGYWKKKSEKNSLGAIKRAFESGRGIESDVRDLNGKLVISHDPADESSATAQDVFRLMSEYGDKYYFAVNVKADGLKNMLLDLIQKYHIDNYFAFDMSVPQLLEYRDRGIHYFTRQSEYERELVLYDDAAGVWMDAFEDESWITEQMIQEHQKNGKMVCIVSPDLHQRSNKELWGRMLKFNVDWRNVFLCTDHPDEASCFFADVIQRFLQ